MTLKELAKIEERWCLWSNEGKGDRGEMERGVHQVFVYIRELRQGILKRVDGCPACDGTGRRVYRAASGYAAKCQCETCSWARKLLEVK